MEFAPKLKEEIIDKREHIKLFYLEYSQVLWRKIIGLRNIHYLCRQSKNIACEKVTFQHRKVCTDNFLVTHSHPYLPGMHHSHTEAQWETVSWFNLLCLDSSHELPIVPFILFFLSFIFLLHGANRIVRTARSFHLRSPPCHVCWEQILLFKFRM